MIEKGEKQSRNLLVRFVAVGKQVAMCDSVSGRSECVCVCVGVSDCVCAGAACEG